MRSHCRLAEARRPVIESDGDEQILQFIMLAGTDTKGLIQFGGEIGDMKRLDT
ncbi:MAG: hypothetical protein KC897_10370 [Candidatus Omnitrophica bacterium]|nr:hypothetical protein [Candidatus Omnitrophota bacterium]